MSDFSTDYYNGIMKAVITQSNQLLNFVDLPVNHPQSIINAAWILFNSLPFFPQNSVFLVVVDPGVGTERKPVIVKLHDHWVVLPDNGIITPLKEQVEAAYIIRTKQNISTTFHGRDLFSPVVRDLVMNKDLSEFSQDLEVTELTFLDIDIRPLEKSGIVTDIDCFGNIITNIVLTKHDRDKITLSINNKKIQVELVHTFSNLDHNDIGAIVGSCNTLELIVNQGSAANILEIKIGDPIVIQ